MICSSAGNHAQAVSYHSTRLGMKGLIVMPETAPFVKVAATRAFGAEVLLHGKSFDDAFAKVQEIVRNEGRTLVHAFNDAAVVAGQGSVAMEILEQNPYLVRRRRRPSVPTTAQHHSACMAQYSSFSVFACLFAHLRARTPS